MCNFLGALSRHFYHKSVIKSELPIILERDCTLATRSR